MKSNNGQEAPKADGGWTLAGEALDCTALDSGSKNK